MSDTCSQNAVGHFFLETCVYLLVFQKLKQRFPNIKLYSEGKRKFKQILCDYFDTPCVDTYTEGCSIVAPPPRTNLHIQGYDDEYIHILDSFYAHFSKFSNVPILTKYLVMPRQSKENYAINDRKVEFGDIYSAFETAGVKYELLETDKIDNIKDQMLRVAASEVIILNSGSAFELNGAFCTNKIIIAVGELDMMEHASTYPRHFYPITKVMDINTVHFCKTQEEAIAILRTMF